MDRRHFISRSFGVGGLLAAGRLALDPSPAWAAPSNTGYQIGQLFPKLRGLDQYDRATSPHVLSNRWTVLDFCPWWCSPCRESAKHHAAFSAFMNEQGIPFHVLSVVTDNLFGGASNREDAERWAVVFGLDHDIVMHCGGNEASPLRRQIALAVWQANQPPYPPAFPFYVLIDPSGVIRYYQMGADLNALQFALEGLTATTLDRMWPQIGSSSVVQGLGWPAAVLPTHVTGVRSDGVPFDETLDGNGSGQLVVLEGNGLESGFAPGDLGFSLDAAVSMHFMPASPPAGRVYRLAISPGVSILRETLEPHPGGNMFAGSAQLTLGNDGTIDLVCEPFRNYVPADADAWNWRRIETGVYYEPSMPYTAALQLEADVAAAAATLPGAVVDRVRELLEGVRARLRQRDYAAAAEKAEKAAGELASAGAAIVLRMNAASLANLPQGSGNV